MRFLTGLTKGLLLLLLLAACGSDNKDNGNTTYTLSGTVTGLTGSGLVLQNNGIDDLTISTDGQFSFATALQHGTAYVVTVATQPSGQNCTVSNGSGILDGSDVVDVAISCAADTLSPQVSVAGPKLLRFSWNDLGADHYRLMKNPDGVSGYSQVGDNITSITVDEEISVHLTDWVNARYIVQACDSAQQCSDSAPIFASALMLDVIGYLKAPDTNQTTDFGADLALSDDAATLAIKSSSGIHIFVRNGTAWSQQALLVGAWSSAMNGTRISISDSGDTLAVGDQWDDWSTTGVNGDQTDDSATDSGAVYIFSRNGDVWSQQAHIKASNTGLRDHFGGELAISGDGNTLAVAARDEDSAAVGIDGDQTDNTASDAGAVYLFVRNAATWSQQAYIKASNTQLSDLFGWDIALSTDGDTLAVASRAEDSSAIGVNGDGSDNSALSSGAVYLFTRDGSSWNQRAYIKASNTDGDDGFGISVALSGSGDLLAVGAANEDSSANGIDSDQADNSAPNAGAVYMFERSGDDWAQTTYIKASNSESSDIFGTRVELSADGDSLAVSASGEDSIAAGIDGDQTDNSAYRAGAVYLFTRSSGSWRQQAYIKASNTREGEGPQICQVFCLPENDEFGSSLGLSGDGTTLAVGAYYEASPDQTDQQDHSSPGAGALYLY